jgi:hypothetical protein
MDSKRGARTLDLRSPTKNLSTALLLHTPTTRGIFLWASLFRPIHHRHLLEFITHLLSLHRFPPSKRPNGRNHLKGSQPNDEIFRSSGVPIVRALFFITLISVSPTEEEVYLSFETPYLFTTRSTKLKNSRRVRSRRHQRQEINAYVTASNSSSSHREDIYPTNRGKRNATPFMPRGL